MADPIEEDDEKMDELLMLQSMTVSDEPATSIEEKWEERIMLAEVSKMIAEHFESEQKDKR